MKIFFLVAMLFSISAEAQNSVPGKTLLQGVNPSALTVFQDKSPNPEIPGYIMLAYNGSQLVFSSQNYAINAVEVTSAIVQAQRDGAVVDVVVVDGSWKTKAQQLKLIARPMSDSERTNEIRALRDEVDALKSRVGRCSLK